MNDREIYERRVALIRVLDGLMITTNLDMYDTAMVVGTIRDLLVDIEDKLREDRNEKQYREAVVNEPGPVSDRTAS
jgi:hypothetical protein